MIDPRPNINSEVWKINLESDLSLRLEDAFLSESAIPLSEEELIEYLKPNFNAGPYALVSYHSEDLIEIASWNKDRNIISHEAFRTFKNSTNKFTFWNILKKLGIDLPYYERADNNSMALLSQIQAAPCEHLVFKPVDGTNSLGLVQGRKSNLHDFIDKIDVAKRKFPQYSEFLLMAAIGGAEKPSEIAVNLLVANSKASVFTVHKKAISSGPPLFRDFAIVSHDLPVSENEELVRILDLIIEGLKIDFGVLQLEFLKNDKGSWIPIDLAMRPDGGLMNEAIFELTGLDFRMAQSYIFSGQYQHVKSQIAVRENHFVPNRSIAIGAFYGRAESNDSVAKLLIDISDKRFRSEKILQAFVRAEASTSVMYPSEHRVAMCVYGEDPIDAVANLIEAAKLYECKIGYEWISG